jgi:hypothetical protein
MNLREGEEKAKSHPIINGRLYLVKNANNLGNLQSAGGVWKFFKKFS